MKIGIVTYHRSHNYGALLQSIATRYTLEKMGHEVYFVDYWPKYHENLYKIFDFSKIKVSCPRKSFRYIKNKISVFRTSIIRHKKITNFIDVHIVPFCKPITEQFDLVIYGSDQIWRAQPDGSGYNPIYFGVNDFHCQRQISYAASMGILPKDDQSRNKLIELLSKLDAISVREQDLLLLLKSLGYQNTLLHIDPTQLLTSSDWNNLLPSKESNTKPYALFYEVQNDSFCIRQMKSFSKARNLDLIILRSHPIQKETQDELCTASPDDFIDLIRNADFVFTSSFHGLVFSITYHRPFYASFSKNGKRAESILSQLNLSQYLIEPMSELPTDYQPINYVEVDKKMSILRESGLSYLREQSQS